MVNGTVVGGNQIPMLRHTFLFVTIFSQSILYNLLYYCIIENCLFSYGGSKLHSPAQTLTIGFAILIMDKGRLPSKMRKFLSLSIARSTWMQTLAMLAVLALAFFDSCFP